MGWGTATEEDVLAAMPHVVETNLHHFANTCKENI